MNYYSKHKIFIKTSLRSLYQNNSGFNVYQIKINYGTYIDSPMINPMFMKTKEMIKISCGINHSLVIPNKYKMLFILVMEDTFSIVVNVKNQLNIFRFYHCYSW